MKKGGGAQRTAVQRLSLANRKVICTTTVIIWKCKAAGVRRHHAAFRSLRFATVELNIRLEEFKQLITFFLFLLSDFFHAQALPSSKRCQSAHEFKLDYIEIDNQQSSKATVPCKKQDNFYYPNVVLEAFYKIY